MHHRRHLRAQSWTLATTLLVARSAIQAAMLVIGASGEDALAQKKETLNEEAFGANEVTIREDDRALDSATPSEQEDPNYFENNGPPTTQIGNNVPQQQANQANPSTDVQVNLDNAQAQPQGSLNNANAGAQENLSNQNLPEPSNNQVQGLFSNTPAEGPETFTNEGPVAAETPPPPPPVVYPTNSFVGAPPLPGSRRIMAAGEAPDEYTIESGDSLYDLCDQLLDEPNYWPKLWALNPAIKNPHFIYPGTRLRFYPGDDTTPPFLEIVEEDPVVPIDRGDLAPEQLIVQDLTTFNDQFAPREVEIIGPEAVTIAPEMLDNLGTWGISSAPKELRVQLPGYVLTEPQKPIALIRPNADGEIMAASTGQVGIEVHEPLQPGNTYSVVRPAGRLLNPYTGEHSGYLYYHAGTIRSPADLGPTPHDAEIVANTLGVRDGDWVVPYVSSIRTLPDGISDAAARDLAANIIAFENDGQSHGALGNIAFIDRGSDGGVAAGQSYRIYAQPRAGGNSTARVHSETGRGIATGALYILDATNSHAIGYITQARREVRLGDALTAAEAL